jgi:hypothetical protein
MIVHYTLFDNDEFGNGALKRSHQITALLSKTDREIVKVSKYPEGKLKTSFLQSLKIGYAFFAFFGLKVFSLKKIKQKTLEILLWKQWLSILIEKHEKLTVVYELSCYADYSLIFACKQLNLKIIGLPHNLESLVYKQKSNITSKIAPNWFNEEVSLLNLFSSVYVISREEQWLLSLYNVNTHYLPYFPSEKVIKNTLEVRKLRDLSKKSFYLSIGTASNPPTIEGFKELLSYFKNSKIQEEIWIAGYETELLKPYLDASASNIKLKGTLDSEQLQNALVNCKAIIIHQKPTTGALTKIPELLLSGIPIICNIAAARNYYNVKGIYIYTSEVELSSLLSETLQIGEFNFVSKYYHHLLSDL